MASLTEMRTAIAESIRSVNPEMHTYKAAVDVAQVPALVVQPSESNFAISLGAGIDEWMFDLYVLVGIPDMGLAQDQLDLYIDGSGSKSIRKIIYGNPTLGDVVDDSMVMAMKDYGGQWETAGIPHIGARLILKVLTIGN